ncbi:hypothetical protein EDD22DRAFT_882813 [Suillus occidentalis]|nr:hypothetical protein EDD22DRAFT_882813 [Suillus occidentalis]
MTPNYESWSKDELIAFGGNTEKLEREFERMAWREFEFAISENAEFLLRAYPDMQIAYLDEEPGPKGSEGLQAVFWPRTICLPPN